jgi:membrane protease YdiL (CAAX protease family)
VTADERAGHVRPWVLLPCAIGALLLSIFAIELLWPEWADEGETPLPDALFGAFIYGFLLVLVDRVARRRGVGLRVQLRPKADVGDARWALGCGVALVGVSLFCVYLVFLPLSHLHEDWVRWWLLEDSLPILWTEGESLWIANAIGFFVLAGLAPVAEEFVFRGLLLPAWAARYGERVAVVLSSAVFAAMHFDPLGSFVFSVVASLAFLRTGRLWVPILVHAANNALVWLLLLAELAFRGPGEWSMDEFRAGWWLGAIGLVIGAPLLVAALRTMPGRNDVAVPSGARPTGPFDRSMGRRAR